LEKDVMNMKPTNGNEGERLTRARSGSNMGVSMLQTGEAIQNPQMPTINSTVLRARGGCSQKEMVGQKNRLPQETFKPDGRNCEEPDEDRFREAVFILCSAK
jgi:hypothetical protein